MNIELQHGALMEWVGWKNIEYRYQTGSDNFGKQWCGDSPDGQTNRVLPFITLDLLHECEGKLRIDQREEYVENLANIVQLVRTKNGIHNDYWCVATASLAQRLEALLRTLDLWREEA